MLSDEAATAIANTVLGRALADAGFALAAAVARPDHAGEDALYVTVTFVPDAPTTTGKATTAAMVELIDALKMHGDGRFPYLVYDYPDDERPTEADLDAAE